MPFKSDKQRKWMHANEPEMAKKWEKEEALKEKLRKVIRQEIKSINEAQFFRAKQMVLLPDKKMYFDPMNDNLWLMGPYGGPDLDDDPIEPRDRDYKKIIRKLSSKDKSVLKKAMRTRKRRKEATTSVSVPGYLSPQAFSKSTQKAIDVDDEDDEKNESINEVRWPDNQTSRLLAQAFKDAKVKVQKVWEKGNHEYIIRVRAKDGWTNVKMELNVVSNVITLDTQGGHVRLGELQPGSRGRKLTKNLKMLSKLPSFGVAGFKGLKYKIESINESDLDMLERSGDYGWDWKNLTVKKGKTVKVTHKKSGKSLIIIDKPNVKREYEKIGYFAEGEVNEDFWALPAGWSSQEARLHLDSDIKKMSKILGKASQQVIKIMMNGVKGDRYDALDIVRGIETGPWNRTHEGERPFMKMLWNKVRNGFRRYSKDRKLRK